MRRLAALGVLLLALWSGVAEAAITEVASQKATVRDSSVPSSSVAFPNNVTSGNLAVVVGALWNASAVTSVTCATTAGSTGAWTTIFGSTGVAWGGGTGYAWICFAVVSGTGGLTVSITPSTSGNYINASTDEFTGTNSSPLDVNGGEATGGPGATSATDTIVTATANDLIIGVIAVDSGVGAFFDGSGHTNIDTDATGARQPYDAEFQVVTTATTYNVDWSWTVTNNIWSVVNAAFKPAGAAGSLFRNQGDLTGLGTGGKFRKDPSQ